MRLAAAVLLFVVLLAIFTAPVIAVPDIDGAPALSISAKSTDWGIKFQPIHGTDWTIASARWLFGDMVASNRTEPTHIYEEPGTYDVHLTATFEEYALESEATRTITVDSGSRLQETRYGIEPVEDRIYIHLGHEEIVFSEMTLFVSGAFCLAAGYYTSREAEQMRCRGYRESGTSRTFRKLSIAWGVVAVLLLAWLEMGGY